MRFFAARREVVANALAMGYGFGKLVYGERISLRRLYRIEGGGFMVRGVGR